MDRSGKRSARTACWVAVALASAAPWSAGAAPLDLKNAEARTISTELLGQTLNDAGEVVDGKFGPRQATNFASIGSSATATIAGSPDSLVAPSFPPVMVEGGISVAFTNGRFTEVSDQTTTLDLASGDARLAQMTTGMIDLNITVAGLTLTQTVTFSSIEFAATDLGSLFVGETQNPAAPAAVGMGPLQIAGPGRVCAMAGSRFIGMPGSMIPTCSAAFSKLRELVPSKLDPKTGIVRGVGVTTLIVQPFTVAGVSIEIQPISLVNTVNAVQRLSEQ